MLKGLYERARRTLREQTGPTIVRSVRNASLTYLSPDALNDLFDQVKLVESRRRSGILIEAGCALGGSAIVMAAAKAKSRPLYVYDVFGMIPEPSEQDGEDVHRRYAAIQGGRSPGIGGNTYYGYEQDLVTRVTANFQQLGVPVHDHAVHLVKGLFQDTLHVDQPVALAHLDGDWHDSVMTCLRRIEPHLVPGGVLVIDDYDHWSGCRTAIDEYFRDRRESYEFIRRSRLHVVRR